MEMGDLKGWFLWIGGLDLGWKYIRSSENDIFISVGVRSWRFSSAWWFLGGEKWIGGWINGWINGWIALWMDGWICGWMNE